MTRRQALLLDFLRERTLAGQPAPSFNEMAAHLGMTSKGGVARLVGALVQRGFVKRLPHQSRGLSVTGIDEYAKGYHAGFRDGQAQRSAA